jgi:hypothetical protein
MSVHLEAFEWTGEPKRIFIAGALNEAVQIFLRIQQELLFRGRRCLVLTDDLKSGQRLRIFQENWDFIIRIRGNLDYSLFASYLQNAGKPISVLWVGSEIPGVLLKKFETVYWVCISNGLPNVRDTYYTFLSPTLAPLKYKDWFLTQQTPQDSAILDSLEEFREKKAGLVVCPNRTVKWYDADSKTRGAEIGVEDVCEVLKWCTGQLEGSDD